MLNENVRFDETSSRYSQSDQPVPLGGVPRALRNACESAGLDPLAELYNEALRFATEGHLGLARERLQMLLCMAPDDGDARILLSKVLVAGQRWQDALAALDEAQNCGQQVPIPLRRAIEEHLRAEEACHDEEVTAATARDLGEKKALRQEARRLRSENAHLLGRNADLEKETKKWAWTTAGVSTIAILFIATNLIIGGLSGTTAPEEVVTAPSNAAPTMVEANPLAAAPAMVDEPTPVQLPPMLVANVAAEKLAASGVLVGTHLEVEVDKGIAAVSGSVLTHRQQKEAMRILGMVKGVDTVDVAELTNLARSQGTTHVVQKGDSLSHIAYEYYGDASLTKPISRANQRLLRGRSNLSIDQVLRIPSVN
jgi:nucleoid-associated protein YgaU